MKRRRYFVSNSSSCSFNVCFNTIPFTITGLTKINFIDEMKKHYEIRDLAKVIFVICSTHGGNVEGENFHFTAMITKVDTTSKLKPKNKIYSVKFSTVIEGNTSFKKMEEMISPFILTVIKSLKANSSCIFPNSIPVNVVCGFWGGGWGGDPMGPGYIFGGESNHAIKYFNRTLTFRLTKDRMEFIEELPDPPKEGEYNDEVSEYNDDDEDYDDGDYWDDDQDVNAIDDGGTI